METNRVYLADSSIMVLHGYLSCLSRLCGPEFSFSSSSFKDPKEINAFISEMVKEWSAGDEYVAPSDFNYFGREVIDYNDLRACVARFIFDGELKRLYAESESDPSVGGRLLWDLFEYFGLASTNLNSDGVFHPLVRGPVYRLDIRNSEHVVSLYLLVKIEYMYVFTKFLKLRASTGKI